MPYVELAGIASYYEQHGAGDPVLLLHGGYCSIETWRPQIEALAPRYRVHAPERPGHGRTADRPGPITFQGMVDDTVAYLDAMQLDSVHVVGFSDGAITGLLLALQHPSRLRSLVSISARLDPSVFDEKDETAAAEQEPDAQDLAYARLSPDGSEHAEVVLQKLSAMRKVEPQIDPAELDGVGTPTLVLAGDGDSIPTAHTVDIARALPHAQLCIIPGAGHLVIGEKPDHVNRAIEEFLEALGSSHEAYARQGRLVENEIRPLLEQSIEIAAPIAEVWALVSDVRRMPDWSPQVTSTRLRSGFETCELGAQFTNRNAYGELEWTTHAEVVRFESDRELAFRVEENWAIWSFTLAPAESGGGTVLTQRRELPDGLSDLSRELTDGFMGGQDAFTQSQLTGMRETLERIKTAAEA